MIYVQAFHGKTRTNNKPKPNGTTEWRANRQLLHSTTHKELKNSRAINIYTEQIINLNTLIFAPSFLELNSSPPGHQRRR